MASQANALGAPIERREGRAKVTGAALYATEYMPPGCLYAWPVTATVARGRVTSFDTATALGLPGVLAVITPESAPRLAESDDPTLTLLQDTRVPHHGWPIALTVGESPEAARAAAAAVRVTYETEPHASVLSENLADAYAPDEANGATPPSGVGASRKAASPPHRWASTCATGCRPCTTTRWSRTERPRPGATGA